MRPPAASCSANPGNPEAAEYYETYCTSGGGGVVPENGLQGSTNPALNTVGNVAYTRAMTALGVSIALAALQNPECANLFGGGVAGTPNPALFLSAMWNAGSIAFGFEEDVVNSQHRTIVSWTNAFTTASGCASYPNGVPTNCNSATITVNTNASTPDNYAGSAQDFAVTILHELGHVYQFMYGQDSTAIQYDALGNSPPVRARTTAISSGLFALTNELLQTAISAHSAIDLDWAPHRCRPTFAGGGREYKGYGARPEWRRLRRRIRHS